MRARFILCKIEVVRVDVENYLKKIDYFFIMTDYYDEISEGYEELYKEEQLKKLEIISKNFKINKNELLLDVGCGIGITTGFWNCRRIGLDPAIKLLKKAKDNAYVNAEAEHIPFKDKCFDVVISITAIQNFDDIRKGLEEIKRVGKNRFVLSFLKKSSKRNKIEKIIHEFFKVQKVIEEDKDLIFIV